MAHSPTDDVRVSHVAIAVTDLEVSTRFYTEGLGFEAGPSFNAGDEVAAVSEVEPPVHMTSRYLTKGGFRLELMGWASPPVHGSRVAAAEPARAHPPVVRGRRHRSRRGPPPRPGRRRADRGPRAPRPGAGRVLPRLPHRP